MLDGTAALTIGVPQDPPGRRTRPHRPPQRLSVITATPDNVSSSSRLLLYTIKVEIRRITAAEMVIIDDWI
jgi:hypothetical protein